MTDSVFHKVFLITCTGFRLRQRHQTAVLHLNLWKLPHGRYSPAKHHVSEVHLIGYASYFNKKSNLSSKLISRSKKLTSEQASWIFLKNYLGILRPGNCWQVWHHLSFMTKFLNQSEVFIIDGVSNGELVLQTQLHKFVENKSGIGMPSPILWSHPLKMQRIVLLSSLLRWELGTNSLITDPGEWLSVRRFTSKLSWSWSWTTTTQTKHVLD